jgi:hypothetical protein
MQRITTERRRSCGHPIYYPQPQRERIARLLLDRKDIDVDAEDNDKNTALAHAVRNKRDRNAKHIRQCVDNREVV